MESLKEVKFTISELILLSDAILGKITATEKFCCGLITNPNIRLAIRSEIKALQEINATICKAMESKYCSCK